MIIIAWLIVVLMTPVDAAAGARGTTVIETTFTGLDGHAKCISRRYNHCGGLAYLRR